MNFKSLVSFISATLLAPVLLQGGVPEPDFMLYGTVTDTGSTRPQMLGEGALRWEISGQENSAAYQTNLRIFGEAENFSYRIRLPAESGIGQYLAATDIDIGGAPARYRTLTIELDYQGRTYPVVVQRSDSDSVTLAQEDRGRSFRIDLEVHVAPIDTDGDGMPDLFEDQYGALDKLIADADLDPDGDLVSNGDEFLRQTDPTLADFAPALLTTDLNALYGGSTLLHLGVADLDDNPAIDPANPDFFAPAKLAYTLLEASAGINLAVLSSGQGNGRGAYTSLSAGATFTHADVLQGKLILVHDGASTENGSISMRLTDGVNPPVDALIPVFVWNPSGPDGDAAVTWIEPRGGAVSGFGMALGSASDIDGQPGLAFDGSTSFSQTAMNGLEGGDWQILAALNVAGSGQQGVFATPHASLAVQSREDLRFPGHISLGVSGSTVVSEAPAQGLVLVDANRKNGSLSLSTSNAQNSGRYVLEATAQLPSEDRLGMDASGNYFEGGLHELLIFDEALTGLALADQSAYLQSRWEDAIVIDALQSAQPFFGVLPSSGLSASEYEDDYQPTFGDAPRFVLLGWNRNVTLFGGHADDDFWFGGGEAWMRGDAGADRFIMVLPGEEQVIADFDENEGDTIDLQYLFSQTASGAIDQHMTLTPDGGDALLEIFLDGTPDGAPDASVRLLGRADLNQSQMPMLYAQGALEAGDIRPELSVAVNSPDSVAVEVNSDPAKIVMLIGPNHWPEGKPLLLDLQTNLVLGEDFKLLADVYNSSLSKYESIELADYRVPVELAAGDDSVTVRIVPIANKQTQDDRSLEVSAVQQPGRYSVEGSPALLSLIDGLPYLLIEPTMQSINPTMSGEGFRITRVGSTDVPLTFNVSAEGTAINGTDYSYIASQHGFSAGDEEILIPARALRYALSENTNILALRLEPQAAYQLESNTLAQISLQTETIVINLDVLQPKAVLGQNNPQARFYLQLAGPSSSDVTMVPLEFTGTTDLEEYEITSIDAQGYESALYIDPVTRTGNVFLLPGQTYAIIKMSPIEPLLVAGEGKTVVASLAEPPIDADYKKGPRDRVIMYVVSTFENWALAENGGASIDNMDTWGTSQTDAGVPRLLAYAFGLDPATATQKDVGLDLSIGTDGQVTLKAPYYEGTVGIRIYLKESDTLDGPWEPTADLRLVGTEVIEGKTRRIYKGEVDSGRNFYRLEVELAE